MDLGILFVVTVLIIALAVVLFGLLIYPCFKQGMIEHPELLPTQPLDFTGIPLPTSAGRPKLFSDIDRMELTTMWPMSPLGRRTDPVSHALGSDVHNATSSTML